MMLTVRLNEEDQRVVLGLRRAKVNVSALVRRALHEAASKGKAVKTPRSAIVAEVIAAYPGPARKEPRPPLDDRRALSAYIGRQIAKR
jgi:hypothetical protein